MCYLQVLGTATKPLISWLLPPHYRTASDASGLSPKLSLDADFHIPLLNDTEEDDNNDGINTRTAISRILNGFPRPQSLGMLLSAPRSKIHDVWRKFDDAYMRPTFGGRGYVRLISRRGMDIPEEEEEERLEEDERR